MEVFLFKFKDNSSYMYDLTINPYIDFLVLKDTRNLEELEVITPEISLPTAQAILKDYVRISHVASKLFISSEIIIKTILKKYNIKKICKHIRKAHMEIPEAILINKIEEEIIGKIISFNKLRQVAKDINIEDDKLINILQSLYAMRRIKVMPARIKHNKTEQCAVCRRKPCSDCALGFKENDVLYYAADNYNIKLGAAFEYDFSLQNEALKEAAREFENFTNSREKYCVLRCAPNTFDSSVLNNTIMSTINNGGKVIYVTSRYMVCEVKNKLKEDFKAVSINITDEKTYRDQDITICNFEDYTCFYKAFELVIYDARFAFINNFERDLYHVTTRAMKEKAKHISIIYYSGNNNLSIYRGNPKIIYMPALKNKRPIPEPRIIISRAIKMHETILPQMLQDIFKWSIAKRHKLIIFTPSEVSMLNVYNSLCELEGIDCDKIDFSKGEDKKYVFKFLKGEINILVTDKLILDIYELSEVNIVVMHSDNSVFTEDILVNMTALATNHKKDNLGEVIFVASRETKSMSLAKSAIRELNKIAWEKGYISK